MLYCINVDQRSKINTCKCLKYYTFGQSHSNFNMYVLKAYFIYRMSNLYVQMKLLISSQI
jgi:hypothetical protein